MINPKKAIIFIDKQKLVGVVVNCRNYKFSNTIEVGWDENTFEISLAKIIEKLKSKKVRILLNDVFSYVIRLKVPVGMNKAEERIFVSGEISEKIPEFLNDRDWDYKEINFNMTSRSGVEESVKDVLVFSPVKYLLDLLSKVVNKTGIEVEAVEPVEIAITRNSNPIIGLALKDDLNREDKEELNIYITRSKKEPELKEIIKSENSELQTDSVIVPNTESKPEVVPKKNHNLIILIILVVFALVSTLAGIYLFIFNNRNKLTETQIIQTSTPAQSPTSSPTPSEMQVDLSVYKVEVLNGTGVSGEAAYVAQLLQGAGFENVKTADASSKGNKKTQIEVKQEILSGIVDAIVGALSSEFDVATQSAVLKVSEFDIRIIVGSRK